MKAPLISVLVPAYNASAWIGEALLSLLNQSYSSLEIIVVDDASKDNTFERAASLGDSRVRIVKNEQNLGLILSLNRACSLAEGKYFARMDADDRALPTRIAKQVAALEAEPEIGVIGTAIRFFSEEPQWDSVTRHPLYHPQTPAEMKATLPFYSSLGHGSAMMRRSIFDQITEKDSHGHPALYDSAFPHAEDFELWSRLSLKGIAMRSLPEILQEVRLHGSSVSRRENVAQLESAHRVRAQWRRQLGLADSGTHFETHLSLGTLNFPSDIEFLDRAEECLLELLEANKKKHLFDEHAWERSLSMRWWQACHALARSHPQIRWRACRSRFASAADPFRLRSANLVLKTLLR